MTSPFWPLVETLCFEGWTQHKMFGLPKLTTISIYYIIPSYIFTNIWFNIYVFSQIIYLALAISVCIRTFLGRYANDWNFPGYKCVSRLVYLTISDKGPQQSEVVPYYERNDSATLAKVAQSYYAALEFDINSSVHKTLLV